MGINYGPLVVNYNEKSFKELVPDDVQSFVSQIRINKNFNYFICQFFCLSALTSSRKIPRIPNFLNKIMSLSEIRLMRLPRSRSVSQRVKQALPCAAEISVNFE